MEATLERSQAVEALQRSQHSGLRRLQVEEKGSSLIISGKVPSYHLKQLAQETVRQYSGQLQLVNRVTVGHS